MKNTILYAILASSYMALTSARLGSYFDDYNHDLSDEYDDMSYFDDYNYNLSDEYDDMSYDNCSGLSKRKCEKSKGCEYSRYSGCISSDDFEDDNGYDDGYDYDDDLGSYDDCYGLSKSKCKRSKGCEYSRNSGCISSIDSENENDYDDNQDKGVELKALTPPEPNMDPPEGWGKLTRNASGGVHMHTSCGCLVPLPWWSNIKNGGLWCFCK
eukprot:scaffold29037_cov69-Cyclotella_meneghiniana.AAC.2